MRHYCEAYDDRYRVIHAQGLQWSSDTPTPIVLEALRRYAEPGEAVLELGCGEGRDARAVLEAGYRLCATDLSPAAIAYCRARMPERADCFRELDCLRGTHTRRYRFVYAVAVLHMLVRDEDRSAFYGFIRDHLTPDGAALICTMGDGAFEMQSDPDEAFAVREREHPAGMQRVAATTCRMVSFETLLSELAANGLAPVETGLTEAMPDFNSLMYAVVKRA